MTGNKLNKDASHGVDLMQKALLTKHEKVMRASFFNNCGYALVWADRHKEANGLFKIAAENDIFPSFMQRSVHNIKSIKSKPLWSVSETKITKVLKDIQKMWEKIKSEAMNALDSNLFTRELENLHDIGTWSEFVLLSNGKRNDAQCLMAPVTCDLITGIPHVTGCPKCDVKFSLMESGTHIISHSGPNNHKLRLHLGLAVASLDPSVAGKYISKIRVANDYVTWRNGQFTIFDDYFDHEVWHFHPQKSSQLILIIDILHPRLSECEIASL